MSAWASSLEGLLYRDIAAVNQRLAAECRKSDLLLPIGCLNLALPGWEHDLHQCIAQHRMRGVRLWPGVHGYGLDAPEFRQLLDRCAASGMFVQIGTSLEDARTQHPLLQVPDTDLRPLITLIPELKKQVRIQLLNHRLRPSQAAELGALPGIYFDTARVDATDGVPRLVNSVPQGRVLHGTHAPFLIPEAALIRVHESGQLQKAEWRAVLSDNATHVLKKAV
jgi:predicted TIM-barrel fold metal-dependent hydrolase